MADLEKTVKIIFEGEDKAVAVSVERIKGSLRDLNSSMSQITTPMAGFGEAILKADAVLGAMAAGGMALAIRESSKFNQGFALISTSVDATGKDLNNYRQDILNYSTTSSKSLEDINGALYTAAQAGIKYGDSLSFLGKAEQLAVANNANLNTTVDLLTGTMNAYGFKVQDVARINDVFFTSTLVGKQTIDSLGQSMGHVVGVAANFGVSFEQLSAAISTLTAKGMETSEAITGIKGVITTIVQPSQETAKAAQAMGLNFSAAALKARGFEGIMQDVMRATGGNADKMALLFNEVRALNAAMQITGDGMKFFSDALNQINNSAGAAEKAYNKMAATLQNQSQRVVNTAKTVMIEIGDKLEPAAAGVAGKFADLLKGVKIAIDQGAFDGLFAAFDDAARKIQRSMQETAANLPAAFNNLDFSQFADALRNVFDVLGTTDSTGLAGAVQTLANSLASLISVTQGMLEIFTPVASVVVQAVDAFNSLDASTKTTIGNVAGLSVAFKTLGPIATGVMLALSTDTETAATLINVAFSSIENGINSIKVAVLSLGRVIAGAMQSMAELLNHVPGYDGDAAVARTTERVKILSGMLDEANSKLVLSSDKVAGAVFGDQEEAKKGGGALGNKLYGAKSSDVSIKDAELSAERAVVNIGKPVTSTGAVQSESSAAQKTNNILNSVAERGDAAIDATQRTQDAFLTSTGSTLSSLFGSLTNALSAGSGGSSQIEVALRDESRRRDEAIKMQKELVEAQVKNLDARTESLKNGTPTIQIDGKGLQPHLEAFMFEILKAIQVRASAEGMQQLVGSNQNRGDS